MSWLNLNKQKSKIQLNDTKKNEFICFEEVKSRILCDKYLEDLNCYDIRSTILISFNNNSYKFEVVKMEILIQTNAFYGCRQLGMSTKFMSIQVSIL